jgi:hypothetical protein
MARACTSSRARSHHVVRRMTQPFSEAYKQSVATNTERGFDVGTMSDMVNQTHPRQKAVGEGAGGGDLIRHFWGELRSSAGRPTSPTAFACAHQRSAMCTQCAKKN